MTRGWGRGKGTAAFAVVLALLGGMLLAGCGGGGGGGAPAASLPDPEGPPLEPEPVPDPVDPPIPDPFPDPGPVPGQPPPASISSGLFLGQGSVIVNGVQFSLDNGVAANNSVFIDDVAVTEGDLRVGMIVKVRGSFGPTTLTGRYGRVDAEPQVIGAVTSPTANGFTVLNQSVTVTPFTIFDNNIARPPATSGAVEVYGSFIGANAIEATFIRRPSADKVQVRGVVNAVDNVLGTLLIGTQEVNFTPPGPAGLAAGRFVEVEGNPVPAGGVIQATSVVIEVVAQEAEGREIEIEGTIGADIAPNAGFRLLTASGPVTVAFGPTTVFEDEDNAPISPDNVVRAGNQVEAEGFMVNGILIASEIELERKENVVLEGTLSGVAGQTVTVSPFSDAGTFTLVLAPGVAPPPQGTHVEVGGSIVQGSAPPFTVSVTRVTPIPDPLRAANLVLQGPVDNVSVIDNTFRILGIPIDLTGVQERDDPVLLLLSEFENAANIRVTRGSFMDELQDDVSVVKAKAIEDPLGPPFVAVPSPRFNPRAGVEIEEHR